MADPPSFDPNRNIEKQRAIVARMLNHSATVPCSCNRCSIDGARLAQLVVDLDGWLCAGGTLPDTWRKAKVGP